MDLIIVFVNAHSLLRSASQDAYGGVGNLKRNKGSSSNARGGRGQKRPPPAQAAPSAAPPAPPAQAPRAARAPRRLRHLGGRRPAGPEEEFIARANACPELSKALLSKISEFGDFRIQAVPFQELRAASDWMWIKDVVGTIWPGSGSRCGMLQRKAPAARAFRV